MEWREVMRIQISKQYLFSSFGTLLVIPSGAVIINNNYHEVVRFVWWWPVNWLVYPYCLIVRLFDKLTRCNGEK
jgi:hypothetical protein